MAQIPQRTLFDLTQDGLIIGEKLQRIYPEFKAIQSINLFAFRSAFRANPMTFKRFLPTM